ncbi:ribosome biogenesis regulatory protein homolog [Agrilus planipennis]|uniref:Ribosome biogenesis regulatory protein n=1 Tax=Agrilus planipennis TaxID=224129 RepID=A0A1W4WUT8_AGRPL|nr:ribosome biogenesis regulatory protein homolog [Agrilus planipennis]
MDIVAEVLKKSAETAEKYKPITVTKHLDLEYDVGSLLAVDKNELDTKAINKNKNDYLLSLTRDNVQLLLNKVWDLPTERVDETVVVRLPPSTFVLPRSKPVPRPKPLTKWQQFALEKGIKKKKKPKLSWDERLKKWVPLYGFKRSIAEKEKDWVIEVPQNADPFEDQFEKRKIAKQERVAKNELQRLHNIAKAQNIKIPRTGLLNPDVSSSKDLQAAVTVARSSTASLGKFQDKLPKEKEARGISAITPGASRKRKLPPVPATQEKEENLAVLNSILNKKPKLDIEKAVNRQINQEETERSTEKKTRKPGGNKINKSKGGKKPKSGKGKSAGRKRR